MTWCDRYKLETIVGISYCKPRAPTHRVLKAHLLRDLNVLFSNSTSPSVVLVPSACRRTSGRVTAALASAMVPYSETFPNKKFAMKVKVLSTRHTSTSSKFSCRLLLAPLRVCFALIWKPIIFELRNTTKQW